MLSALLFLVATLVDARRNDTREFIWDEVRVATWNVVLEPWIPTQDLVIENIFAPGDVDVIHFTECWTTEIRDRILKTKYIRENFRYHYWPTPHQGTATCDLSNPDVVTYAEDFIACVLANGIAPDAVIEPFLTPLPLLCEEAGIGLALVNFDPNNWLCFGCLIAEMQFLNADNAFDAIGICGAGGLKNSFNGNTGQLIVSRYPIRDVKEVPLEAWVVNRMNIYATINNIRMGFTHMAYNALYDADPELAPLFYGATQIDHAMNFVENNPDVVMGDFNSGGWYQPTGVDYLFSNGYSSVFGETEPDTNCPTVLDEYPLCQDDRQGPGFPGDHILIKKANKMKTCPWEAKTFGATPLMSDHLGIKGKIYKSWFSSRLSDEIKRRTKV